MFYYKQYCNLPASMTPLSVFFSYVHLKALTEGSDWVTENFSITPRVVSLLLSPLWWTGYGNYFRLKEVQCFL